MVGGNLNLLIEIQVKGREIKLVEQFKHLNNLLKERSLLRLI